MTTRRSSSPEATGKVETGDLVVELCHQHRGVEEIFALLDDPMTGDDRRLLAAGMITELLQHADDERRYLHPVLRQALPDGHSAAEADAADHQRIERLLLRLQQLGPDSDELSAC